MENEELKDLLREMYKIDISDNALKRISESLEHSDSDDLTPTDWNEAVKETFPSTKQRIDEAEDLSDLNILLRAARRKWTKK